MSTWEENVRKVTPYTPGEQPNRPQMIKLNTNENPYPPQAWLRYCDIQTRMRCAVILTRRPLCW